MFELNILNTAFQYPDKSALYHIGSIFGEESIATTRYALLTGPILIMPFILSSMVAGMASDKFPRVLVLSCSSIMYSMAIFATGFAQNYITVVLLCLVIGFSLGFFVPPTISLILDFFPVEK